MEAEIITSSPSEGTSSNEDQHRVDWGAEHRLMLETLAIGPPNPPNPKDISVYGLALYANHLYGLLNAQQSTVDMSSLQSIRATREILELADAKLKSAEEMMAMVNVKLHNTERHVVEKASHVEKGAWKIQCRVLDAMKQGLKLVTVNNDDDVEMDQPFPWVSQNDPEPKMPGRLKLRNWGFTYTFRCEDEAEVAAAMNFDFAEFESFEGMRLSNAAFVDIFGHLPVSKNDAGFVELEIEDESITFAYDVNTRMLTISAETDPAVGKKRIQ